MRREATALALLVVVGAAQAQLGNANPDGTDPEAPPPPALRTDGLIPLEIGRGTTLRYGVDPASVSISRDGVVRYVVVATSPSGAVNGIYEGVRCGTAEVMVYARYVPGSGWSAVPAPKWQPLRGTNSPHSLVVARDGACMGNTPNHSATEVVRDLRAPAVRRFGSSSQ